MLIDPFDFLGDLSVMAELSAENVQNLANGPGRSRAMQCLLCHVLIWPWQVHVKYQSDQIAQSFVSDEGRNSFTTIQAFL